MQELVHEWTSLPNLHPALVHFPIALTLVAWLCDLGGLVLPRRLSWLSKAATLLWLLAGLGAGLAYWAGREAADSLIGVSPQLQARISSHADWAAYTLWVVGAFVLIRIALAGWGGDEKRVLAVAVVLGLAAVGVLAYTADLGGGLVYRNAVAVNLEASRAQEHLPEAAGRTPDGSREDEGGDPQDRLERSAGGVVTWVPLPSDAGALGTVLQAAEGAALDPVRAATGGDEPSTGLSLEVTGRTLLVLPGRYGDVEVAAVVDFSGFRGVFGLAHHVASAGETGLLTVEVPAGRLSLKTLRGTGDAVTHDEEEAELPSGPLEVAASAAGRHLRGSLDGNLVVHGHVPSPPEGGVGILVDGEGRIRILRVTVTPISD